MIRVILADDHTILRDKLRELLAQVSDFEIVGHASNDLLLLEVLEETPADVVLLDVSYVLKNASLTEIIYAIRAVSQNKPFLSTEIGLRVVDKLVYGLSTTSYTALKPKLSVGQSGCA